MQTLTLTLFVLRGLFADNVKPALAFNNLAVFAPFLD